MVGDSCYIKLVQVKDVSLPLRWHKHKTKARVFTGILLHSILLLVKGGELHHWGFVDRGVVTTLTRNANRYANVVLWFLNIAHSFLVFVQHTSYSSLVLFAGLMSVEKLATLGMKGSSSVCLVSPKKRAFNHLFGHLWDFHGFYVCSL